MARLSINDLKEMRLSGQIMRTDRLLTILDQHGFMTRRAGGGTSHIFIWNPNHPEISTDVIVAETSNPIYQRKVIDACIQTLELEATVEENLLDVVTDFEEVSGEKFIIPEEFEIVKGRKKPGIYLRHRKCPQIATELVDYQQDQDISEWCDYLLDRANQFEQVLKYAVDSHDFERTDYSNGAVVLMHPSHRVYTTLYPFTPRLQNFTCIGTVEDCIAEVQLIQEEYNDHLKNVTEPYDASSEINSSGKGKTFKFQDLFIGEKILSATLTTTPNGYFSFPDFIRFSYEFDRQAWQSCKSDLKRYYGFEMTRLQGGFLQGKHALLDVEFTIPDVRKMPSPDERLRRYYDLSPEEQDAFGQELDNDFAIRYEAYDVVFDAMKEAVEVMEPLANECSAMLNSLPHMALNKKPKYGEILTLPLCNKDGDQMNLKVLALSAGSISAANAPQVRQLAPGQKVPETEGARVGIKVVPTEEDLLKLRSFVSQHHNSFGGVDDFEQLERDLSEAPLLSSFGKPASGMSLGKATGSLTDSSALVTIHSPFSKFKM